MRLLLASSIRLWFILILQGNDSVTTSSDICSSVVNDFNRGSGILRLQVKDTIETPTNCLCEIFTNRPATYPFYFDQSAPCSSDYYCRMRSCACTDVDSTPTCISMSVERNCSPRSDGKDSCPTSNSFTLKLSMEPSSERCTESENNGNLVLDVTLRAIASNNFYNATCTARFVSPDAPSTDVTPTIWNSWSTSTTTAVSKTREMIIDIFVGVGAVLLITAIVIAIVILRLRAKSNKPRATNISQARASVPSETAYESYAIPVSAAYDNATIGSPVSYQTLAVGESNDGYTEIKEPEEASNHNGYDNYSRIGRNEVYSMRHEMGKEYSVQPSVNTANETTVIDNEFYG